MGGQNGVMASRKMVFLDVDGTYLAGGVVPPSASDAVRAARANGHQVLLCTGRPLVQIFDEITEAGFDGVIASAGGMVTYRGETLHSTAMEPDALARAIAWLDRHGIAYWLESDTALLGSSGLEDALRGIPPQPYLKVPFTDWDGGPRTDVRKIVFLGSTLPLAATQEALTGVFDVIGHTIPDLGESMGEISVAGIHKAAGIEALIRHAGVDRADTIAFGDGSNDLEMLAYAGVGVAMGDAADAVKAVADLVVAPAAEGGIAEGFRRLRLV